MKKKQKKSKKNKKLKKPTRFKFSKNLKKKKKI